MDKNNSDFFQTASYREDTYTSTNLPAQEEPCTHQAIRYARMLVILLGTMVRKELARHLDGDRPIAHDWHTLADCFGYSYIEQKEMERNGKTIALLDDLAVRRPDLTVGQLHKALTTIKREDAADQLLSSIDELQQMRLVLNTTVANHRPLTTETYPLQSPLISSSNETTNEAVRALARQVYLLFNPADEIFALGEIKPRLEQASITYYNSQDSAPPGSYFADEHITAMQECRKVIIVLSDALFDDPNYAWLRSTVLDLDSDASKKKIIPVVYKPISSPLNIFRAMVALDRTKFMNSEKFWNLLVDTCTAVTN